MLLAAGRSRRHGDTHAPLAQCLETSGSTRCRFDIAATISSRANRSSRGVANTALTGRSAHPVRESNIELAG